MREVIRFIPGGCKYCTGKDYETSCAKEKAESMRLLSGETAPKENYLSAQKTSTVLGTPLHKLRGLNV